MNADIYQIGVAHQDDTHPDGNQAIEYSGNQAVEASSSHARSTFTESA